MKVWDEPIAFEWDKGNIDKNLKKHNVTNQEAEEIFINEPLIIAEDTKHSDREKRFYALGKTSKARRLFLSFTIRKNKIRIISIRDMNKKEKETYAKA